MSEAQKLYVISEDNPSQETLPIIRFLSSESNLDLRLKLLTIQGVLKENINYKFNTYPITTVKNRTSLKAEELDSITIIKNGFHSFKFNISKEYKDKKELEKSMNVMIEGLTEEAKEILAEKLKHYI